MDAKYLAEFKRVLIKHECPLMASNRLIKTSDTHMKYVLNSRRFELIQWFMQKLDDATSGLGRRQVQSLEQKQDRITNVAKQLVAYGLYQNEIDAKKFLLYKSPSDPEDFQMLANYLENMHASPWADIKEDDDVFEIALQRLRDCVARANCNNADAGGVPLHARAESLGDLLAELNMNSCPAPLVHNEAHNLPDFHNPDNDYDSCKEIIGKTSDTVADLKRLEMPKYRGKASKRNKRKAKAALLSKLQAANEKLKDIIEIRRAIEEQQSKQPGLCSYDLYMLFLSPRLKIQLKLLEEVKQLQADLATLLHD